MRTAVLAALITAGLFTAPLAPAAAEPTSPAATISVTGDAVLRVDPDQVTVSVAVRFSGRDKAQVSRDLQQVADGYVRALKEKFGLPEDAITADNISIYPSYEYRKDGKRVLAGYDGSRTITAVTGDLSLLPLMVQEAMDRPGITVGHVSYSLKDPSVHARKVREMAVKDSLEKGRHLAGMYNARLTRIESVSYSQDPVFATVEMAPASARMMKSSNDAGGGEMLFFRSDKIELRDRIEVKFATEAGELSE